MTNHRQDANSPNLPLKTKIWYGVGYLSDSLLNNAYSTIVFILFDGELKLGAASIGLVALIIRIWEAGIDPCIGNLTDRTRSRWGSRHPYVVAGSVAGALCTILIWNPPTSWGSTGLWWYLLIVTLFYYTAFSIFSVPYFALGLAMSNSERDRDGIMGWRVTANSVVLCAVPLAPMLIYNGLLGRSPLESLSRLSLVLAALILGTGLMAAKNLPQPPVDPTEGRGPGLLDGLKCAYRNRPFLIATGILSVALLGVVVSGTMSYYMNLAFVFPSGDLAARKADATQLMAVTGFGGALVGLCVAPFVAMLASRFGRKPVLTAAFCIMSLAFLLSPWLYCADYPYAQMIFSVLLSFGITFVFVLTAPMVGEVCDIDELENGAKREGIFAAMFNFGFKVSIGLAMYAGGYLVSLSGFSFEVAEQAASTLSVLRGSYIVLPVFCFAVGLCLVASYPLNAEVIRQRRLARQIPPG